MLSQLDQEFVELVTHRGWDIRRMKMKEKTACRRYIIAEIYKYLRSHDLFVSLCLRSNCWVTFWTHSIRVHTHNGEWARLFKIDDDIINSEVLILHYFWSYNERNKRRVKLIGNFHELCQGGKIRKVIPMDLLRYIMEFY